MPSKHKNTWIFQTNPKRYNILSALRDTKLDEKYWLVNRYKKEIGKGDIALIWMSGKEAGIYAVSEITSDPLIIYANSADEKYWVNEEDKGKKQLRVKIKIKNKFLGNPIFRRDLKNIEGLKDLSILKFSQGTNFPVSNMEWRTIKGLMNQKSDEGFWGWTYN